MKERKNKIKATDHESYTGLSLLAFFIPLAGIILGVMYMNKKDPLDIKLGNSLVVIAIISSILVSIFWYFWMQANISSSTPLYPY